MEELSRGTSTRSSERSRLVQQQRQRSVKKHTEELSQAWETRNLAKFTSTLSRHTLDLDHVHQDQDNARMLDLIAKEPGSEEFLKPFLGITGCNVNEINRITSRVAAHYAAEAANAGAMGLLLEAGADVNIQDGAGDTPLHVLIQRWDHTRPAFEEVLQMLLGAPNVAVNVPNSSGHTPMTLAAAQGNAEAVGELLHLGQALDLDTFRNTDDNKTAREVILQNFPGLEEELPGPWEPDPDRGALDFRYRLFYFLLTGQEIRFCQVFREATALKSDLISASLVSCYDGKHYTYLQHAAERGFVTAARTLVKAKVNVNLAPLGTEPPVILATRNGSCEVLSLLLSIKDVDLSPDANGETLLHVAVKTRGSSHGHRSILRRLIRHPAVDVNAKDHKGRTALHFAVTSAEESSIFLLLDNGARLDVFNNFGETPLRHMSASTLKTYLDSKISTNDELPKHCDYTIKFDYSFATTPNSRNHIYDISTELLSQVSKTPDLRTLLAHPIYATIILFKWQRIRTYFYLDLFCYTLFCCCLTSYVFFAHQIESAGQRCNNLTINDTEEYRPPCFDNETGGMAIEIFILVFLTVLGLSEIFQCVSTPRSYFKTIENYIQIAVLITSFLVICSGCPKHPQKYELCHDISALAIFFAWFEFFFVIGKHPKLTFYIDMFRTASSFLLVFLAVHTPLVLAFVFSFYILFRDFEGPFTTVWKSLFKTIIMITGEYDFGEIPLDQAPFTSHLLFAAFIFLVAIVLFNLLIGLAVSATRPIEDDAFLFSCIAQVPIINFFENLFFKEGHFAKRIFTKLLQCVRKKSLIGETQPVLLVFPNQHNRLRMKCTREDGSDRVINIRYHLTQKIVQDVQYILTNKLDAEKTKCDKMDELKQQMESTKIALEEELRTIKTALVDIMHKFESHDDGDAEGPGGRRRAKSDLVMKKLRQHRMKMERKFEPPKPPFCFS